MIYEICDIMMSISTRDRMHLWVYLLNHNSLSHQTCPVIDINKGNNFQESFEQFGGLRISSRSFLSCSCFARCIIKKTLFFIVEERNSFFFCYFHYEFIFYSTKLFECPFSFKFCWNIFIFFNINTNQTSEEQNLNFIRSSHLFWDLP